MDCLYKQSLIEIDEHRFLLTDLRKLAYGQFLEDHINLWFDIFSLLDLKSQLGLLFTCCSFNNNLSITDFLYDVEEKYLDILTDNILGLSIFKYVTKLKCNNKITNVSFMRNLKKLDAYGNYSIDQNGIKGLDLVELDVGNNPKITNVLFMKNLKVYYKN